MRREHAAGTPDGERSDPPRRSSPDAAARPLLPVEQRYGRRSRQSLQDIVEFADHAAELVARGRDAYDGDVMLRLAGEAIASRIGEAVARLDPRLAEDHPEIPFRLAKGMRDFVSHHYDRVDADLVWATLQSDVPAFAAQVRSLLP